MDRDRDFSYPGWFASYHGFISKPIMINSASPINHNLYHQLDIYLEDSVTTRSELDSLTQGRLDLSMFLIVKGLYFIVILKSLGHTRLDNPS